jgi:hypothetical protein
MRAEFARHRTVRERIRAATRAAPFNGVTDPNPGLGRKAYASLPFAAREFLTRGNAVRLALLARCETVDQFLSSLVFRLEFERFDQLTRGLLGKTQVAVVISQ